MVGAGLWAVQGALAALFLFAGGIKFTMPPAMYEQGGMPAWFIYFIGACEALGALGLILPGVIVFSLGLGLSNPNAVAGAVGPYPHMAGLAAAVLGVMQMTGSALYGITVGHLSDGTATPMALAIATAGLTAFIGFALVRLP